MIEKKFDITGMTCAACERNVERAVGKQNGVKCATVNLLSNSMKVTFDENETNSECIINAVEAVGYGASVSGEKSEGNGKNLKNTSSNKKQEFYNKQAHEIKAERNRIIVSVLLLIPLLYIAMGPMIGLPTFWFFSGAENALILVLAQLGITTAVLVLNKKFFISGFKALFHIAPNMDSLVATGSLAAYLYGIVITFVMAYNLGHGRLDEVHSLMHSLYFESAATILTLVSLGKYFEAKAKQKTSSAIEKLINLSPKTATILKDGKEIVTETEKIAVGDIVVIKNGDTIPVDGEIIEGEGLVNQSAITGESVPIKKCVGENVISATICENGTFKFRATKVGEDTTLSEIIKMVDEAGNSKAPIARIADKVSGVFVPIVMAISVLTFFVWIIATQNVGAALTYAVSVLVISCPCALGLATPVAIMVATGKAASLGILTKSAEALERLSKITTVVLDKTGTITEGKPLVTDIIVFDKNYSEEKMISEIDAIESGSNHLIAKSIKDAVTLSQEYEVKNFEEISGRGVKASINGKKCFAGNFEFAKDMLLKEQKDFVKEKLEALEKQEKTAIVFVKEKSLIGIVAIADKIKDGTIEAIKKLQSLGLKVVMLTGDNKLAANAIAKQLGIVDVVAEVLPTQKQQFVKSLQERGEVVAMVGDGINDSPALALADIGIAVSNGTDIAIESADIVLTGGALNNLVSAILLSRATLNNIKMNLFWAFFYNAVGIPIAAGVLVPILGIALSPMLASLAMSLSSVCVVLNALRINLFKPKIKIAKNKELKSKNIESNQKVREIEMNKEILIEGMMCGHCVNHVESALKKIDGIISVNVSLENKSATVVCNKEVQDSEIISAIKESGYEVVEIK